MGIKKSIKNIYTEQPGEHIYKKDAPYQKFLFIKFPNTYTTYKWVVLIFSKKGILYDLRLDNFKIFI